eukprot:COSAG01_NODE_3098_length_6590_cov_8.241565_2_plen_117_part_00
MIALRHSLRGETTGALENPCRLSSAADLAWSRNSDSLAASRSISASRATWEGFVNRPLPGPWPRLDWRLSLTRFHGLPSLSFEYPHRTRCMNPCCSSLARICSVSICDTQRRCETR